MQKRHIAKKLVVFLLASSLLASCTPGNETESENSAKAPNTATDNKDLKNNSSEDNPNDWPTMTWIVGSTSAEVDDDAEIVKNIENRFKIDLKAWRVDDTNTMAVRLAGGEMPDVMVIGNLAQLPEYVKQGILHEMPLEELKSKAPTYAKAADDMNDPTFWSTLMYDGKNWGAPQPMEVVPMAMIWRKDWLDKLGLEVPETLDEYEKVLTAFVEKDPDGDGTANTAGMAERAFNAIFGAYGLRCVTGGNPKFKVNEMQLGEDNVPFFPWTRPEAKEALALLNDWYNKGIIDKEFVTGENSGGYAWLSHSFMNNRIGLTCAQPYHYLIGPDQSKEQNWGVCMKELKAVNPDAEITFGPAPVGPNGKSGTEGWNKIGRFTALTTKAFKDQRIVDAFYQMLDAYYSDMDYARMVNYGIKGVHWDDNGAGPYRIMEGVKLREQGVLQVDFGSTIPYAREITKAKTEFGHSVTGNGYYRFAAPPVDEFAEVVDTLNTLTNEAYFDMISGKKPLDYFDTFVEEFNNAGGKRAEEAVQKAYAEKIAQLK